MESSHIMDILNEMYLTDEQTQEVLRYQMQKGGLFGMICLELGYINETQLLEVLWVMAIRKEKNLKNY